MSGNAHSKTKYELMYMCTMSHREHLVAMQMDASMDRYLKFTEHSRVH